MPEKTTNGVALATKRVPLEDKNKTRPAFEHGDKWHYTNTPSPEWQIGSGASDDAWKSYTRVSFDPAERAPPDNYRLMISAVVPRPIGFVSTASADDELNLAPFSYTTMVNHDPPVFCIGFALGRIPVKDTLSNILATKELTLNIISEWFVEAANYCSTNAPPDISEWALSGLTQAKSTKVKPPYVAESAFAAECVLLNHQEFRSPTTGKVTGVLCVVQGVEFHVFEEGWNAEKTAIDPAFLRPVSRLGGVTYGRSTVGYEMTRPEWADVHDLPEIQAALE
ncbi:uncharacterized protein V1518DRAFT_418794 [Limtongia smithiae]|uniref:uncharacterized protein n=1 Tax=Limtongia smithiae TaxID=1125753 RepID=UPI0034CD244A